MNKSRVRSDFLFAMPSPLAGVARLFDFAGTFDAYNASSTPDEADAKAMYADWAAVGDTLCSGMDQFDSEEELRGKAA